MGIEQNKRHPLSYRILHELIIISIFFLIITGFYIHSPFMEGFGFLMSLVRGVHFFFAGVLGISTIIRIITLFVGKDRDLTEIVPQGSDLKLLPKVFAYYTYMGKEVHLKKKYNPLQMLSYSASIILILFMGITGIAMMWPDGPLAWLNYGLFKSEVNTRIWHYIVTWLFVIFAMIHVYLTVRENFPGIKEMHLLSDEKEVQVKKKA